MQLTIRKPPTIDAATRRRMRRAIERQRKTGAILEIAHWWRDHHRQALKQLREGTR